MTNPAHRPRHETTSWPNRSWREENPTTQEARMTVQPRTSFPLLAPLASVAVVWACAALLVPGTAHAQTRAVAAPDGWAEDAPALTSLVDFARGESDLRIAVERYVADRAAIRRRYEVPYSP